MISNMVFLGFYEHVIDRAVDIAERAVNEYGNGDIDSLHDIAVAELEEFGSWSDPTNSIIGAYFRGAEYIIGQCNPDLTVDYFVNCEDSDIIVNGECI